MHSRGFHYLIFILMVILLALISSRTAAVSRFFVGIRSGSHVLGRLGEKGHPAGDLCLSLRGSIGLGHRRWICYPGSEGGTGNTNYLGANSPVLGDHFTIWDRKPEGPSKSADFAWVGGVGIRNFSRHLRSCGRRQGYADGSLVISSGVSSVFGSGSSDILGIFGMWYISSGVFFRWFGF